MDYIGTYGDLIPIDSVTEHSVSYENPYEVKSARTHQWAFVKYPEPGTNPRTWSLTAWVQNHDMGRLAGLVEGYGRWEPLVYLPEIAQNTNMITLSESIGNIGGGTGTYGNISSMVTPEGKAPVTIAGPAKAVLAKKIPVLPNKPYTASVWVTTLGQDIQRAYMEVAFYSAENKKLGTYRATAPAHKDTPQKLTYQSTTLANAAYVELSVSFHRAASQASFTFTKDPVPWSIGESSASCIITKLEAHSSLTQECSRDTWRKVSMTIEELI